MAPPGQFIPPPKGDIAQLAGLARFLAPHARRIAGALCALLVASACVLALGQGLRVVIDTGFGSGDQGHLNLALAGFLLVAAVLAIATWFRFYLMMSTGERVVADLRRAVYNHVLSLSPPYFDSARTGEIVSRLTNDTTQLQQGTGFGISLFLRNALMTAGAVVLLFVASPKLAALIRLGIPPAPVPLLLFGGQRVRVKAWLISLVMLIGFCAVGLILWIGGQDVLAGRMTAGELSAFVFYAVLVATGAATISEVWGEIQRAAGATERLMELLDTPPEVAAPEAPERLPARRSGRGAVPGGRC